MTNSKIFIISGPAGVGKDTILKGIVKRFPDLLRLSTYTTRKPRVEEKPKQGRIFISEKKFKEMINNNEFIEWAKVHKWYYGAKKSDVNNVIKKKKSAIIFDIDVKGGIKYKQLFPKEAVLIFIKFGKSIKQLKDRIRKNRPHATKEEINLRYQTAKQEMGYVDFYDYVVINPEGHPEKAIQKVARIIRSMIE